LEQVHADYRAQVAEDEEWEKEWADDDPEQ
jgi:hypothetical protein